MKKVSLVCRKCKRARRVSRDKSDPVGTSRIECLCPKCDNGGFDDLAYFDADGKQLLVP